MNERFFAPLHRACRDGADSRACPEYTDLDHALCGVGRVIHGAGSGRDWIQRAGDALGLNVGVSKFFDALRSGRRTGAVRSAAQELAGMAKASAGEARDPLSAHRELAKFAVYATDGHTLAASAHEGEIMGKVRPHTHIFSLSLRHHSMSHLELCSPETGMKKEHEIAALKRAPARALRMGERKGTKVIHCYDPAIIEYALWERLKRSVGVYIITLEKSNSALALKSARSWDAADPRNNGALFDEAVASCGGIDLRRVTYCDPATGKYYKFLTNEMTLPPGIIAFLYKLRWDIEKVFDQTKNKFGERKGWAKSEDSKRQQAHFITMAHNLCVIFERLIEDEEGIVDDKSARKRGARREEEKERASLNGNPFSAMVAGCSRITQRSLQFIRWLRLALLRASSWRPAIERLRPLMLKYIS